jgi:hypothetical protein
MKLRTALKICRTVDDPWWDFERHLRVRYNWRQLEQARRVCRRRKRWLNDERCRYLPTESEIEEREEIQVMILKDIAANVLGMPREAFGGD